LEIVEYGAERWIAGLAIFAVGGTAILCGVLLLDTFYGDSTIYLIYARNISKGDWFSFNPQEFSSGSTSPLWATILALGFILPGDGVIWAKIISFLFTLLALFFTYRMCNIVGGSKIVGGLGLVVVFYFLAIPGFLLYESSLLICLVAFLVVLTSWLIQFKPTWTKVWPVGVVWSAIPLVRPDALVVVLLSLLALIIVHRRERKSVLSLIGVFLLSLLPALLYFGYSYVTLGVPSTSGYCRTFAMRETARRVSGFYFSSSALELFSSYPLFFWLCFLLWGAVRRRKDSTYLMVFLFSALVIGSYFFMFSFVFPAGWDVERYMLPVVPFIALGTGTGLAEAWGLLSKRKYGIVLLMAIFFFLSSPVVRAAIRVKEQSERGLTFSVITERRIIEYINQIAEEGATVLIYEVQDRYYLRSDLELLSLDGITDGKIIPYLDSGDITSFLWRYQPRYWLANKAVFVRPFLAHSILREVVEQTGEREGSSIEIEGITFVNLRVSREPRIANFASYRQLYLLVYETPPY